MNKQNFEAKDRFPLSTQALTFMQEMIMASAQLALIGGDNYILSGCETNGNNVSSGVIVINGEVMPFEGGVRVDTITVVETPVSVSANGLTFENARVTRKAKFASGTGANYFPWANFKPLQTNGQLEQAKATIEYVDDEIAKIQAGSIPVGVIVMWSGPVDKIPAGWQLCDNSLIPGTNERTPDLRGKFIVGYNHDDTDYDNCGKTGGAKEVALKVEQLPKHRHIYTDDAGADNLTNDGSGNKKWGSVIGYPEFPERYGNYGDRKTSASSTGSGNVFYTTYEGESKPFDNRPPYYVLAFIIKTGGKE